MGVYDIITRAIIESLGGYSAHDVQSLCLRANNMAILAKMGKYKDSKTAIMVIGHDRIIDRITTFLGYPRRKRSIPRVEVIQWDGKRAIPIAPSEVVNETRPECLLAKITGSSIGAQLDIQRECIPSDREVKELQGKEQVLDLVSSNSVERMQSSPPIQAV